MKGTIQDVKTTIGLFFVVRQARKDGGEVQVRKVRQIPLADLGYWGWTMEASLFYREKWAPVRRVFDTLDKETKHALTFAPKSGEWPARVRFWQDKLKPALPPKLYHEAIIKLLQHGIRCRKRAQRERGESMPPIVAGKLAGQMSPRNTSDSAL